MMLVLEKPKTAADLARVPDDGAQYELIAGEIIMVPPPTLFHQDILGYLYSTLDTIVRPRRLGKVLPSPVNVYAKNNDVYQPDILFVRRENFSMLAPDGVHGAPDIVIEILSPSNAYYDLKHKKDIYEQIGVREYWIVDPMDRSIECYQNSQKGFETFFLGKNEGRACSRVVPEFCVEVADVFAL
jgi:Uma2 family endonuclease